MRWLFSFCFSFTELQLETVSKAFHITLGYPHLRPCKPMPIRKPPPSVPKSPRSVPNWTTANGRNSQDQEFKTYNMSNDQFKKQMDDNDQDDAVWFIVKMIIGAAFVIASVIIGIITYFRHQF